MESLPSSSTLRNGSSQSGNIRRLLRRGRCTCRNPPRIPFVLGSQTLKTGTRDRILNPQELDLVVLCEALRRPPPPFPSHSRSPLSLPRPSLGYLPVLLHLMSPRPCVLAPNFGSLPADIP